MAPSTAAVQDKIEAYNAVTISSAVCSGFLYAMSVASSQFVRLGI
jgi:3-oxoacyl-[acyl-carrier-protein] synthase III